MSVKEKVSGFINSIIYGENMPQDRQVTIREVSVNPKIEAVVHPCDCRCVMCGEYLPEGYGMVCKLCERDIENGTNTRVVYKTIK